MKEVVNKDTDKEAQVPASVFVIADLLTERINLIQNSITASVAVTVCNLPCWFL